MPLAKKDVAQSEEAALQVLPVRCETCRLDCEASVLKDLVQREEGCVAQVELVTVRVQGPEGLRVQPDTKTLSPQPDTKTLSPKPDTKTLSPQPEIVEASQPLSSNQDERVLAILKADMVRSTF